MTFTRSCPVCEASSSDATLFLEERIDYGKLSGFSYASRKDPEYMCHRLVRCLNCELIYASNPPLQDDLAHAYHIAEYDSSEEANAAALSYMKAISPILSKLETKVSALEIGAGTGVFLEFLKNDGFKEVIGVEPSAAAIFAAPESRRKWLQMGIFEDSVFEPEKFDLICCFMTMEHVRNPMNTSLKALSLLKPGGVFVTITHDYASYINRIMGSKSPIIDIEHMQLFSKVSIRELFKRSGFNDVSSAPFFNRYNIYYWIRLAPLPKFIKYCLKFLIAITGMSRVQISLNVGNTITAGFRPTR
jgi:SAM-dependent methyltransferase